MIRIDSTRSEKVQAVEPEAEKAEGTIIDIKEFKEVEEEDSSFLTSSDSNDFDFDKQQNQKKGGISIRSLSEKGSKQDS
jgi:hypothetical protein